MSIHLWIYNDPERNWLPNSYFTTINNKFLFTKKKTQQLFDTTMSQLEDEAFKNTSLKVYVHTSQWNKMISMEIRLFMSPN